MKDINFLFPIFLLLFVIFPSCKNEPEFDDDLLVGSVRIIDHNIPYPFLLERTEEGMLLIDHRNNVIDSTTNGRNHYASGDTINMQDHEFLVMNRGLDLWFFDKKDSSTFPYEHPMYAAQFVRAIQSNETNSSAFIEKFQTNTYQSEVGSAHFATPNRDLKIIKTLEFSKDKLQTTFTYYYHNELVYAEKEMSKYAIFERKGKVFLSEGQDRDNSVNLFQVTEIKDDSFSLRSFRNNEEQFEEFEISEETGITSENAIFERCMEGQPGEYYHDNLTYTKGNEFLINKISDKAPKALGDGYITIHFTINCKGEMGHLGLEQMDPEFQSTFFEPALVKHVITEVMDLKDWPEIKPGQFYKDIHSFLMFKVKNGKITDVSP